MSLIGLLNNLFLRSLLDIYDGVFSTIYALVGSVGVTIILFGLFVNLALSPLYHQMERSKRASSQRRDEMEREIARIKKHYHGRERYYYVQTIHRVYGYTPIAAVLGSSDLYLQLLVFSTIYRYLAHHPALHHTSFLSIPDLGHGDELLFGANLLPMLMTLLNVVSTLLYTVDAKQRRTGILIALVFLTLLYASPSGVVLYWTCNNAFSLLRNLIERKLLPRLPSGTTAFFTRLASQE